MFFVDKLFILSENLLMQIAQRGSVHLKLPM